MALHLKRIAVPKQTNVAKGKEDAKMIMSAVQTQTLFAEIVMIK